MVLRFLKYFLVGIFLLLAGTFFVLYVLSHRNTYQGVSGDLSRSDMKKNPPPPLSKPVTLKIVTFNIQNLWVVGRHRPQRMRAIAAKLSVLDPDIVGFQEAFVGETRELLMRELRENTRLQYMQYYPSGWVGSGLLICSAFPIVEAYFTQYRDSNPWYKVWEGDFWAGKGVALARIQLPDDAGYLDFFDTHAQAGYGNPYYDIVRQKQMSQLADFIFKAQTGTCPVILVGDMNCRPGEPDFEACVRPAGLERIMAIPTSIDHIFGKTDAGYTFEVHETVPIAERVRVNNLEFDLSDHNGFMTTVTIHPKK
jgi:sphingomyelin phosphodiesterase 2